MKTILSGFICALTLTFATSVALATSFTDSTATAKPLQGITKIGKQATPQQEHYTWVCIGGNCFKVYLPH